MAAPNLGDRNPNFGRNDARRDQHVGELILDIASKCAGDRSVRRSEAEQDPAGRRTLGLAFARARRSRSAWRCSTSGLFTGHAPPRLVRVRDVLVEKADAIVQRRHMIGGQIQERVVHLPESNLDLFSAAQIDLVDRAINDLRERPAAEVSLAFSTAQAWQTARHPAGIPYEAVFLSDEPVSNLDIERTRYCSRSLVRMVRWRVSGRSGSRRSSSVCLAAFGDMKRVDAALGAVSSLR